MKPITQYLIIALIVVAFLVLLAVLMGWITIPGISFQARPPGSSSGDCDYTDYQIVQMFEEIAGKELNNADGIAFVRALNMEVCGSTMTSTEIISHYKHTYADWTLAGEETYSRSAGWTLYSLIWTEGEPTNSSFARSIMVGSGNTVQEAYGYNTMVLTADGPMKTYQQFIIWLIFS